MHVTCIGSEGHRTPLLLCGWREGKHPVLVTSGCALYVVDLETGLAKDDRGYVLRVSPHGLRRLRSTPTEERQPPINER